MRTLLVLVLLVLVLLVLRLLLLVLRLLLLLLVVMLLLLLLLLTTRNRLVRYRMAVLRPGHDHLAQIDGPRSEGCRLLLEEAALDAGGAGDLSEKNSEFAEKFASYSLPGAANF